MATTILTMEAEWPVKFSTDEMGRRSVAPQAGAFTAVFCRACDGVRSVKVLKEQVS